MGPITRARRTRALLSETAPTFASPKTELKIHTISSVGSPGIAEGENTPVSKPISLPAEFVAAHTPEFIRGAEYVLGVDPSLFETLILAPFSVFAATETDKPKLEGPLIHQYWYALVRGVIAQQVSGTAANSIESRFRALFTNRVLAPATISEISIDELRLAGLSASKVKYIINISEVMANPESTLCDPSFYEKDLAEIIDELQKLKGVGPWLATMFALFTLHKLDVFAADDLGVARGTSRYLKARPHILSQARKEIDACERRKPLLKRKAKFAKADSKRDWVPVHDAYVDCVADQFKPYRSVFMLLMWRLSATNVNVLNRSS